MVKKKSGNSKRTTLKDKYKAQSRVLEHHRKQRKKAKKDAKAGIHKHTKKRDPGIPNSWPFKQDLLQELERAKDRQAEKVRAAKEERKECIKQLQKHQNEGGTIKTLEEYMARTKVAQYEFEARQLQQPSSLVATSGVGGGKQEQNDINAGVREIKQTPLGQSSRRAYLRELKKTIDASDVILQILDARDPLGTRAPPSIEDSILSHVDKRMVLVLNKIDLVPKHVVRDWLTYLRKSHPTIALKAATGSGGGSAKGDTDVTLGRAKGDNALQSANAVGMEGLLHLLKNYARVGGPGSNKKTSKGSVVVGIVGYPNVGKSSILNSLKRCRAVGVSPRPGFTTSMQEVVLDKNIRLVDSPGVVFDDTNTNTNNNNDDNGGNGDVLLRNCIDVDSVPDPTPAIGSLLRRCTQESLMMTYAIPAFSVDNPDMFLGMIAKKFGKVRKGGIPDKVVAARIVLRDWNSGKVPYYTPPPNDDDDNDDDEDDTMTDEAASSDAPAAAPAPQVVKSFGAEFDVKKMMEKYDEDIMGMLDDDKDEMDFVEVKADVSRDEWKGRKAASSIGTDDDDDDDVLEEGGGGGGGEEMSDGDEEGDGMMDDVHIKDDDEDDNNAGEQGQRKRQQSKGEPIMSRKERRKQKKLEGGGGSSTKKMKKTIKKKEFGARNAEMADADDYDFEELLSSCQSL